MELGDKGTLPAGGTSAVFSGLIRKELENAAKVMRAMAQTVLKLC